MRLQKNISKEALSRVASLIASNSTAWTRLDRLPTILENPSIGMHALQATVLALFFLFVLKRVLVGGLVASGAWLAGGSEAALPVGERGRRVASGGGSTLACLFFLNFTFFALLCTGLCS
jgi:hypothetical protein